MKIAIAGGGLSGLALAHRLIERDPSLSVVVLEASARPGGILGTIERDGFVIETGPDSILTEKPAAIELAKRLGIGDRIIATRSEHRGAHVVCRGRLERVPEGFSLLAPARWDAWLKTPIVSPTGKLRAMLEPLVPKARVGEPSLARFVERRLGREVLDRLAQPLVGGIYGGDPELISLQATMPRFVALEREHGSVVRGLRKAARDRSASGARYGLFAAFDRGMQVLIDALVRALGDRVRTGCEVRALDPRGVVLASGELVEADGVVLALPAWRTARLIEDRHRRLADALCAIPYGSAATVTFAWPRAAIGHPLDSFGFVVPSVERRAILAATFASVKWPGRAPAGEELVRVCERDDASLIASARRELAALLGVRAEPRFSIVGRYRDAMPQYHVGHLARVDAIEAMARELDGVFLAGNAYRGVGIPDTVRYAETVADHILTDPMRDAS
jgi:oxygen-dependent protoporphyrinogen oxidase